MPEPSPHAEPALLATAVRSCRYLFVRSKRRGSAGTDCDTGEMPDPDVSTLGRSAEGRYGIPPPKDWLTEFVGTAALMTIGLSAVVLLFSTHSPVAARLTNPPAAGSGLLLRGHGRRRQILPAGSPRRGTPQPCPYPRVPPPGQASVAGCHCPRGCPTRRSAGSSRPGPARLGRVGPVGAPWGDDPRTSRTVGGAGGRVRPHVRPDIGSVPLRRSTTPHAVHAGGSRTHHLGVHPHRGARLSHQSQSGPDPGS